MISNTVSTSDKLAMAETRLESILQQSKIESGIPIRSAEGSILWVFVNKTNFTGEFESKNKARVHVSNVGSLKVGPSNELIFRLKNGNISLERGCRISDQQAPILDQIISSNLEKDCLIESLKKESLISLINSNMQQAVAIYSSRNKPLPKDGRVKLTKVQNETRILSISQCDCLELKQFYYDNSLIPKGYYVSIADRRLIITHTAHKYGYKSIPDEQLRELSVDDLIMFTKYTREILDGI